MEMKQCEELTNLRQVQQSNEEPRTYCICRLCTWTLGVSLGFGTSIGVFPAPPTAPVVPALTGGALAGDTGGACIKNFMLKI